VAWLWLEEMRRPVVEAFKLLLAQAVSVVARSRFLEVTVRLALVAALLSPQALVVAAWVGL